ncbi:MAG: YqzL family protein [Christensenellales bacterium]
MNKNQLFWKAFEKTGNTKAYLRYQQMKRRDNSSQSV